MYTLNCPFDEKDEAKRAGARWLGAEKKWYVPKNLYNKIENFNKWKPNGRMYLNCPYKEKNEAKKKGACFDAQLKKWYFIPGPRKSERDFAKWLGSSSSPASAKKAKKAETKKSKTPPKSTASVEEKVQALVDKKVQALVDKKMKALEDKKVKASSTPTPKKASPTPSPAQMSFYQMNNFAAGNMGNNNLDNTANNNPMNMNSAIPPWMNQNMLSSATQMNQMHMNMNQNMLSQMNNDNAMNNPAAHQWMNQQMGNGNIPSQMKNPMNLAASPTNPKKRKKTKVTKDEPVKKKSSQEDSINMGSMGMSQESQSSQSSQQQLRLLPRVTSSFTKAQLSHELLHRDSSVTGTSNKNKQWFLDRLGLGSVWTSSPQCKGINIDSIPKVTGDMTIAQLSHELLERNSTQKGMSGKNKAWYIEKLCIGSLWITGSSSYNGNNNLTEKGSREQLVEVKMKVKASNKKTIATSVANTQTKSNTENGKKAKILKSSVPCTAKSSTVTKRRVKAENTTRENTHQSSVKAEVVHSSTIGGAMKRPKLESAASAYTNHKDGTIRESPVIAISKRNVKAGDTARKHTHQPSIKAEVVYSSTIGGAMKRPKLESSANVRVDHKDTPVRAFNSTSESLPVPKIEMKTKIKCVKGNSTANKASKIKVEEMATKNAKKVSVCPDVVPSVPKTALRVKKEVQMKAVKKSNGGGLSTSTTATKISKEQKSTGSKAITESTPVDAIPCVSSSMTIAQLKAECKARNPDVKGLSKLNKTGLIAHLLDGSELEGSLEWRLKAEREEQELHVFTSRCHPHPLAKACHIKMPGPGTRTVKQTRADVATCDVGHSRLCQMTAFFSCKKSDFDICKTCYEIESLSDEQKGKFLEETYSELRRKDEEERKRQEERHRRWMEEERLRDEIYERESKEREAREQRESKERKVKRLKEFLEEFEAFPRHLCKPNSENLDEDKKLKYTVWTSWGYDRDYFHSYDGPPSKKFNSSFNTLEEANNRVQYVFYADNEWELEFDEMHVDEDKIDRSKGTRLMCVRPDDMERWTVSVIPSKAFDFLYREFDDQLKTVGSFRGGETHDFNSGEDGDVDPRTKFSKRIRNPIQKCKNAGKKLKYTIWTSNEYYKDDHHDKLFNSSYDTLKEANERVEFVFYFENPWERDLYEMHVNEDFVDKKQGHRYMECSLDGGSAWKVSVVPSDVFDYLDE